MTTWSKIFGVAVCLALLSPSWLQTWGLDGDPAPLEIIDALGRPVRLIKPPRRVVAVFSSNAEIVAALGYADLILAIDALTFHPPEIRDCPKIGGRLGLSLEQIVARKPDLVLLTPARQAVHTLLPTLEKLNIPAVVITSRNVEEIKDNLRKIAGLLGDPPAGESVISRMERRLAEIGERGRTMIKPRVLLITGLLPNGLFLTAREGSYTADIVTLAGGIQALEETGYPGLPTRVPQMSPETLLLADPDIIIHTRRQGESPAMSEYLRRPFFSDLKAIRGGHVYEVPSAEFLIPGPRVVDGAERLASIFERWAQR